MNGYSLFMLQGNCSGVFGFEHKWVVQVRIFQLMNLKKKSKDAEVNTNSYGDDANEGPAMW